ncbi:radical SAM protein [Anaerosporobacter faecicola]|uniref:radical SAM protein n=1 Tax=Anaerosporobacter faecicola TaxID=2718714 RepID=UPI00143C886F|nr:radical SAM protein [Anaerosporobacter faecicola]
MSEINLGEYLYGGIEKIIKGAMRTTLRNPRETVFLGGFAKSAKKASKIRKRYEEEQIHVPAFLIASITTKCNLHCAGCYARANHSCFDAEKQGQMTGEEWGHVFSQAKDMGVSFILLAGGEPFLRKDVLEKATLHKEIIFPIFTNGTMFDLERLDQFDHNRNLVPILSIEGKKDKTDARRGLGMYERLQENMEQLKKKGILYGVSVTVTKTNQEEVMSEAFTTMLVEKGAKVVIYVEYVPVDEQTTELALTDEDRNKMEKRLADLRMEQPNLVFVSFPGDEKTSGGCLAAGRGFFHINAMGGAEPCPFSPYSDCNVREKSLLEALQSPLFQKLRTEHVLMKEHMGGCVLFEQKEEVERIIKEGMKAGRELDSI